ncbi:uncharacterized protein SCHCODRAFT_02602208 [Schizophyllum commune H4-8]|uniref:Uncharacterized protein n=1 Tax=Schizophyllum commune (strain H4-8 / FGSC 9210) TaxID=578458 RepID=D8QEW9_SCHCM|nr:uncharacterized protein SCHCODRAFT_02602208 [Schizophyllum commune H4-8]KAI5888890.1 hypothetical protein SCHCODRAFT_02602208 [Schizophyllum commune H4-8]
MIIQLMIVPFNFLRPSTIWTPGHDSWRYADSDQDGRFYDTADRQPFLAGVIRTPVSRRRMAPYPTVQQRQTLQRVSPEAMDQEITTRITPQTSHSHPRTLAVQSSMNSVADSDYVPCTGSSRNSTSDEEEEQRRRRTRPLAISPSLDSDPGAWVDRVADDCAGLSDRPAGRAVSRDIDEAATVTVAPTTVTKSSGRQSAGAELREADELATGTAATTRDESLDRQTAGAVPHDVAEAATGTAAPARSSRVIAARMHVPQNGTYPDTEQVHNELHIRASDDNRSDRDLDRVPEGNPSTPREAIVLPDTSETRTRKPNGECGKPGKGGYNLQDALGWPAHKYNNVRKEMNKLVDRILDGTKSLTRQESARMAILELEMPREGRAAGDWATALGAAATGSSPDKLGRTRGGAPSPERACESNGLNGEFRADADAAGTATLPYMMPSVGLLDPSPMMSQLPGSEHSACSAARISGVWGFRGAWTIDGSEIRQGAMRRGSQAGASLPSSPSRLPQSSVYSGSPSGSIDASGISQKPRRHAGDAPRLCWRDLASVSHGWPTALEKIRLSRWRQDRGPAAPDLCNPKDTTTSIFDFVNDEPFAATLVTVRITSVAERRQATLLCVSADLLVLKESSTSYEAVGGHEVGGRLRLALLGDPEDHHAGAWGLAGTGEEAYDPTLAAMHLPEVLMNRQLLAARASLLLLLLLLAAAVDLSRDRARGACIDVQVGGDHGESPACFVGWDSHGLPVHLHLPVLLPLTRLLPRLTNLQHPLATEWRRLEDLFRLDSIVSTLIELVHPRTLDVAERVISDVLRELVKALCD